MKKLSFILFLFSFLTFNLAFSQTNCRTFVGTISQIKSILPNSGYCFAVSTDYGTGNWYKDTLDMVSIENTGTILIDSLDHNARWKRIYSGPIYVDWWGAKGDDSTNDQKAIQKCFDDANPYQTICFSKGSYIFDPVHISVTDFTIDGKNANLIGTIIVGNSVVTEYNAKIMNCTFTEPYPDTPLFHYKYNAIELQNCRKLEIVNNVFKYCDTAIKVLQYPVAPKAVHTTGIIEIRGNLFDYVNYCFYVDRTPSGSWENTNDCTFADNVANFCYVTAVKCDGIDGLKYLGNTIFTPTDTTGRKEKLHFLELDDESASVMVSNNNLFESGQEAILATNCKNLTISGNNFDWCGQSNPFSVIRATGNYSGILLNVTGNLFNGFSGNVIQIDTTTFGNINSSGNNIYYESPMPDYFGKENFATMEHYVVSAPRKVNSIPKGTNRIFEKDFYNNVDTLGKLQSVITQDTMISKYESLGLFAATSYATDTLTTNNGSAVAVINLADASLNTSTFSGILNVTVKNKNTSFAKTSTYLLLVNKAVSTVTESVNTYQSAGLLLGASSNDPSFKFTISNNQLLATPVGATSGTFYFIIQGEGDLIPTQRH